MNPLFSSFVSIFKPYVIISMNNATIYAGLLNVSKELDKAYRLQNFLISRLFWNVFRKFRLRYDSRNCFCKSLSI